MGCSLLYTTGSVCVFVDISGLSVIVVVVYWGQDGFEIADEIKRKTKLFLMALEFKETVLGVGIF